MAKNKITMTSEEQWTTMQSLFENVINETRRNTDKLQKCVDKATGIDLSQDTQKTLNITRELYSILEDDLALVENVVTIRNIENMSERAFVHSYKATAVLWGELTNHVEAIAWLIVENNIPVTKLNEKIGYSGATISKEACRMVKSRVDILIEQKDKENAN